MTITDEMLSAFIDGELSPADTARVREALKEDENLDARLKELEAPDQLIATAYGAIDNEPMPEGVLALLQEAPAKTKTGEGNVITFPGKWLRPPQQWAAPLAASVALAIGVGAGMQLASGPGQSSITLAGYVDSKSALHSALMTTPSGETVKLARTDETVTPILSFETKDGRYCREFSITSHTSGQRALACQTDGQWRIEIAIASAPQNGGGYATASSGVASQFDAIIDDTMAGDAFDSAAEKVLIEDGWK